MLILQCACNVLHGLPLLLRRRTHLDDLVLPCSSVCFSLTVGQMRYVPRCDSDGPMLLRSKLTPRRRSRGPCRGESGSARPPPVASYNDGSPSDRSTRDPGSTTPSPRGPPSRRTAGPTHTGSDSHARCPAPKPQPHTHQNRPKAVVPTRRSRLILFDRNQPASLALAPHAQLENHLTWVNGGVPDCSA